MLAVLVVVLLLLALVPAWPLQPRVGFITQVAVSDWWW
jgi:hypothetical protein